MTVKERKNRIKARRLMILDWKLLLVLLVGAAFAVMWFTQDRQEEIVEESIKAPVFVTKAEEGDLRRILNINGYIESESMVTILPKIVGSLMELNVDMGDMVEKNELVGVVDSEVYELQLQQAEAAYLAYKSTYDRVNKLYQSRATSQQNYDEVKAQFDANKAQYELAQLQYSYTDIVSPVRGVVLVKHTSVGSLVAPQIPIVTIGDLDSLVVKAKIPEDYYYFFLKNKDQMTIEGHLPALEDKIFEAKITKMAPYISPETKNFETVCEFKGDTSCFRPGMFIDLTFVLDEKKDVYKLPYNILVGGNTLWYADPETGIAHSFEYEPGFGSDEEFEIPAEYKDYLFIEEGQHFLKEGHEIRILNSGVAAGEEEK